MKASDGRDLLAALSLANLSLIGWWDGLLNYTPSQASFLERAPPRTEYVAAFANILLIGLLFFLLIRLARWIAARYGTPGLIFGSLPILALLSLPAGKSIVRLIMNRFPEWDLSLVLGAFALLIAAAALVARRRFLLFVSATLVTISPLLLIETALSISKTWTDRTAQYANGPLAPRTPPGASRPRIVWIIFDELDYRLAFVDRPSNVPMESFDRLRKESLFAEGAVSPAADTILSVPSLLTGKSIADVSAKEPGTVLFDGVSASTQSNIFSTVHAMGANIGVVGWYLPYCRLFARDLAACSSHDLENELSETGVTFLESLSLQQQSLFSYGYRSILGESPRSKLRLAMLSSMRADATRDAADPSLNLVFLHLPVPHAPYLYDRFTYTFPKRYLGAGSYYDNLALADVFLTELRDAITAAGLWDTTTLLVSSDHPDRMSLSVDGKDDPRVPFLLKMAGQSSSSTYEPMLHTIVTKPLLEAILKGEVVTPEDAEKWLTASQ